MENFSSTIMIIRNR